MNIKVQKLVFISKGNLKMELVGIRTVYKWVPRLSCFEFLCQHI